MREDIWVDDLNFQSYQNNEIDFIDDSGKSCCVHSLSDRLKEERTSVCNFVKAQLKLYAMTFNDYDKMLQILDIVERGE